VRRPLARLLMSIPDVRLELFTMSGPTLPDDQFELYREYLSLVGEIATDYASFEDSINGTIIILAGIEDRRIGICLTTEIISIHTKLRILIALLHERKMPAALIEKGEALSERAIKVSKFRNKYVHTPVQLGIKDKQLMPMIQHFRIEKTLKGELAVFDRDEMRKTIQRCNELEQEAADLLIGCAGELAKL
jgi:hypothetical protein